MIGTVVNTITVLIGSTVGTIVGDRLPEKIHTKVMEGIGLVTILIGMKMAFDVKYILVVIGSIALGGVIGEAIGVEEYLEKFADKLKKRFASEDKKDFVTGFVTSTLLFTVGPMTILGCVQDGLYGNHELLFAKSMLDGISSLALASAMGVGVIFSAPAVLVIQGGLTLLSSYFIFLTKTPFLQDFTSVGGLIIIALGLRLLRIKDIKPGNFLPGLVVVIFLDWIATLI